jgi:hypothetical protein
VPPGGNESAPPGFPNESERSDGMHQDVRKTVGIWSWSSSRAWSGGWPRSIAARRGGIRRPGREGAAGDHPRAPPEPRGEDSPMKMFRGQGYMDFDEPPAAPAQRHSPPSVQAAAKQTTSRRQRDKDRIVEVLRRLGPLTDERIGRDAWREHCPPPPGELVTEGLVVAVDHEGRTKGGNRARRCGAEMKAPVPHFRNGVQRAAGRTVRGDPRATCDCWRRSRRCGRPHGTHVLRSHPAPGPLPTSIGCTPTPLNG